MKRLFLFIVLSCIAQIAFAQLVWKSDFELAIDRAGVVYSVKSESITSIPYRDKDKKIAITLNTFATEDGAVTAQDFLMIFGNGLLQTRLHFNVSEIDKMIDAATKISDNPNLVYIVETGNMKFAGEAKGSIKLIPPLEGSKPGDFMFSEYGTVVKIDAFVEALNAVKARAAQ